MYLEACSLPSGRESGLGESCLIRATRGSAPPGVTRSRSLQGLLRRLATGRSPSPTPTPTVAQKLVLKVEGREQLTWSSVIAKKYILKDNDWRRSIRNQGVMTEVWLSTVSLVHGDGTASVTVSRDVGREQPAGGMPRYSRRSFGRRALLTG